ncbi:hypothetical protein ACIA8F_30755 [Streptomyces sp. NPDC051563]|uniref:hypothetical protein n=1 Tax=Streptomyces sp. NPDC051563 TaxID=3365659 RepID=UPI0037BD572B
MSYGTPPVDRLALPPSPPRSAHLAVRVARLRRAVWLAVRGADPPAGRFRAVRTGRAVPSGSRPLA